LWSILNYWCKLTKTIGKIILEAKISKSLTVALDFICLHCKTIPCFITNENFCDKNFFLHIVKHVCISVEVLSKFSFDAIKFNQSVINQKDIFEFNITQISMVFKVRNHKWVLWMGFQISTWMHYEILLPRGVTTNWRETLIL
jgi:hypothetical protein